ncbi:MAG: hypothetical protein ACE366_00685 [Bradymonadia bacterium]
MSKERSMLNCGQPERLEMTFRCPLTWAQLTPTDEPRQRACHRCNRTVYLCHDIIEADLRAQQGECIAVPVRLVEAMAEEQETSRLAVGGIGSPSRLRRVWDQLQEDVS